MKDELVLKIEKMIKFYSDRYNKKGLKKDRQRRRILASYLSDIEKRLK